MKHKYIIPLLVATSITGGALVANHQQLTVYADEANLLMGGTAVEITGFDDAGELGKEIVLPTARVLNAEGTALETQPELKSIIKIYDPRGRVLNNETEIKAGTNQTANNGTNNTGKLVFIPQFKGYYTIRFEHTENNKVTTLSNDELMIFVTGEDYSVKLPVNSQHVIPAIIPKGKEVKIPLPKIFLGSDEITEIDDILQNDLTKGLRISAVDRAGVVTEISHATNGQLQNWNATGKYFTFTPTVVGAYEIVYEFYDYTVQDYKTQRFVLREAADYNVSNIKLNFSYTSARPTSFTLGQEVTLPGVNVFDKNDGNKAINAFVDVKVTHVSGSTRTPVALDDPDLLKFTPRLKGRYEITYQASIPMFGDSCKSPVATILVEDVKDNLAPEVFATNHYKVFAEDHTRADGVVLKKGEIELVFIEGGSKAETDDNFGKYTAATDTLLFDAKTYAATGTVKEKTEAIKEAATKALSNKQFSIPSIVALSPTGTGGRNEVTVTLPSLYASDNFSSFNDFRSFTRSVRTDKGITTVLNKTVVEGSSTVKRNYEPWETAKHTFTAAGDYTIRYTAVDADGNERMSSFNIKVVANESELKIDKDAAKDFVKPEINFRISQERFRSDETVTFNRPTATDTFDTRVEVRTFYSLDDSWNIGNATWERDHEITETTDSGKLKLDLGGLTLGAQLWVRTYAWNDYADAPTYATQTLTIIDISDSNPPTMIFESVADNNLDKEFNANLFTMNRGIIAGVKLADGADNPHNIVQGIDEYGRIPATNPDGTAISDVNVEAFRQKDRIILPKVTFADGEDESLEISVKVRNPFGKIVSVTGSSFSKELGSPNKFFIENGTFTADYSGVYTITYTATDAGGNSYIKSFGIRVRSTVAPTLDLSSSDAVPVNVDVGQEIIIPKASIRDSNGLLMSGDSITTNKPYPGNSVAAGVEAGSAKGGTYWELRDSKNVILKPGYSFKPLEAGEYVIVYTGWDANGNRIESREYPIVAENNIKPEITLETDYRMRDSYEWSDSLRIKAPAVQELFDGIRDADNPKNNIIYTTPDEILLSVKVFDENNEEVGVTRVTEYAYANTAATTGDNPYIEPGASNDPWKDDVNAPPIVVRHYFTPRSQGVYTIRYTATNKAGKTTTLELQVNIGDVERAGIAWRDEAEDLITRIKTGEQWSFAAAKLLLTDDYSTESELYESLVVTMYDPDARRIQDADGQGWQNTNVDDMKDAMYKWTFDKVGTYELKVQVTDKSGKTTTQSYYIVSSDEEVDPNPLGSWLGTVLIILSVIVLGGVVLYFVFSGRKPATGNGKKKFTRPTKPTTKKDSK